MGKPPSFAGQALPPSPDALNVARGSSKGVVMVSVSREQGAVEAPAKALRGWRLAAFSAPAIPLAALLLPVTVYLPDYYATNLGVDLGVLAFVFMAVRVFDLWFDPALGFAMDKTNTRFGRFRPWFVGGAPIAMVAAWMLFMAPKGAGGGYLLFWLVAAFVGQSMAQLGHMAWAAVAAPSYDQRSKVYGWGMGFTVLGLLSVLALPPILRLGFGFTHAASVQAMGWFVVALIPPTLLLALWSTPEPTTARSVSPPSWKHYWDLLRRRSVLRVLAADIAWGTGPAVAGSLFFFYFDALRGYDRGAAGLLLLVYFVGALAGSPIWTRLAGRFGKHQTLMVAGVMYAIAQLGILFVPPGLVIAIVTMFIAGLPFTAGPALLRAMMADLGDEERLHGGIDRTGLLFSLLTGSVKIGSAAAVGIGLSSLNAAGFEPRLGAANAPEALTTLKFMFAMLPAALGILTAWIISGHKLDATAHADIRQRLDERDRLLHSPFE
jgi:Na+/melibiose symporter-like transporter